MFWNKNTPVTRAFPFFHLMMLLASLTVFIILSIFAILLLIPADPFTRRYTTVGVVLLVLDSVAIAVAYCEFQLLCWHYHFVVYPHNSLTNRISGPTANNVAQNAV